jgi:hypothetical protein
VFKRSVFNSDPDSMIRSTLSQVLQDFPLGERPIS